MTQACLSLQQFCQHGEVQVGGGPAALSQTQHGRRALPAAPRSPCGRCSTAERVSRSATYLLCKWAGPCRHWSQVVGAVWRMARSPSETPCGTRGSVESTGRGRGLAGRSGLICTCLSECLCGRCGGWVRARWERGAEALVVVGGRSRVGCGMLRDGTSPSGCDAGCGVRGRDWTAWWCSMRHGVRRLCY